MYYRRWTHHPLRATARRKTTIALQLAVSVAGSSGIGLAPPATWGGDFSF